MNKKLISVLMEVVMLVAVLATPVNAAFATEYGSVKDCTAANSLHTAGKKPSVSIKGNGTETITVTYNEASLTIVAKDKAQGRDVDAAWVGITVTPPTATTHYKEANDDEISAKPTTFNRYFPITLEEIQEAKKAGKSSLTFKKEYTWYKKVEGADNQYDEGTTQTIYVVVELNKVKLYDDHNVVTEAADDDLLFNGATTQKPAEQEPEKEPADEPATKPSTSDKDEEPKTGITATAIVATATVAMISLAGVAISKK